MIGFLPVADSRERSVPLLPLLLLVAALASSGCATSPEEDFAAQLAPLRVCADGPTVSGIDVSYWQQNIDWDRVAGAGVRFAFIRASHGLSRDTFFDRNWGEARRVGIARGAYHYFEPDLDVERQADLMIEAMATLEVDDLPPVLDVEDTGGLSADEIASRVLTWVDRVEEATGRQVLIYTGKYFWQDNVGSSDALLDHPLWVPQYGPTCPDLPTPWTRWVFFQTSSTGRVDGIEGNVDLDLFNGDMAALDAFIGAMPECGDALCNGDETHDSCPGDCPICEPVPPTGRVVDDAELCFEPGGDLRYWRSEAAGWGDSLLWTYTVEGDTSYNYAVWHLDVAEAGRYLVEVSTPAPYGMSRDATYVVRHDGIEEAFPLDQTAVDGWSPLIELDFAAGGDQWIRVSDNTGEPRATDTQLVADAVRLTRLDLPAEDGVDTPGPAEDGTIAPDTDGGSRTPVSSVATGGCSAMPGAGPGATQAWLAVLLGLALGRRRRTGRARRG